MRAWKVIPLSCLLLVFQALHGADDHSVARLYVNGLKHRDPTVRLAAIESLRWYKDASTEVEPYLLDLIHDTDPNIRFEAVRSLGGMKSQSAITVSNLVSLFKHDPSVGVRTVAADALGSIGQTAASAVSNLVQGLYAEDTKLAAATIQAIVQIAPDSDFAAGELIALLGRRSCELDRIAFASLLSMSSKPLHANRAKALPATVAAFNNPCRETKSAALDLFKQLVDPQDMPPAVASTLMVKATDPDEDIRIRALAILATINSKDGHRLILRHATNDPDHLIRVAMVNSLKSDQNDLSSLTEALSDPSWMVRTAALARIEPSTLAGSRICNEIARLTQDEDVDIRRKAVSQLQFCEREDHAAKAALLAASTDPDAQVREGVLSSTACLFGSRRWQSEANSASVLSTPEQNSAIEVLLAGAKDPSPTVRAAAAVGLPRIAPLPESALPLVSAALDTAYPDTRLVLIQLLSSFGKLASGQAPRLIEMGNRGDSTLQTTIVQTLGLICTNLTQCNQFLEVALGDTNAGALAAIALARFPPTDVTLNKLLQKVREGDRTVGIEWALKEIGDPAVEALKLLRTNTNIRTETDSSGSIQTNGAQHIENALKVLSEANAEIEVRDLNGTRQRILANQRNVVIAVATWCPHSLAFVQLLSDSAIQKLLPERTFTFVFSDEWPRFEQMLDGEVRAGVKTQAQARQALSERRLQSGHPLVTDPEFLNLLPGRAVFSAGDKGEPAADSYPMVFDPARKRYTQTAANWALRGVWLPDFIRQQVRW